MSDVFLYRGRGGIPKNAVRAEVDPSVREIPDRLFAHRYRLESVRLHDGLRRIGARAFFHCSSLRGGFRCPSTVTEIGEGAFIGCSNLADVALPEGLASLPDSLFRDCRRLESALLPPLGEIPKCLFKDCRLLRSVSLRDGLRKIGEGAFLGCSSLRGIRLPSTLTRIGPGAFCSCRNLTAVALPEGLASIEERTFSFCASLEGIRIPVSVARIGDRAFYNCGNLASIELREGPLRTIGTEAFGYCFSLENLDIPSSVEDIGARAFANCINLSSARLHEGLERIGRFAFRGCPLERIGFVRLSERMGGIALDERTASAFGDRLNEIANAMVGESDNPWEECRGSLRRAHDVLTFWELREAATVLELALWRKRIDEEGGVRAGAINNGWRMRNLVNAVRTVWNWIWTDRDAHGPGARDGDRLERERNTNGDPRPSREECRIKCGADVEITEVLKFFSYSATWS